MHPEVAEVIAERESRSRHRPQTWTRKDQADENMWTLHDNNKDLAGNHLVHGMPYGICTVCEYLKGI